MIDLKASGHRAMGLCVAFTLSVLSANTAPADEAKCKLTPEDKAANAKLSFDEFDQMGVTASTWRALEEAGCHKLAVEAAEDYLVNGPVLTPSAKSDVLFHIAQSLAFDGDNPGAALMVTAAIPPGRDNHGDLDWTTYLIGTWAFLAKDRARLDAAATKVAAEPGNGNRIDGDVLKGLAACFDKPYAKAYVDCRPPLPKH